MRTLTITPSQTYKTYIACASLILLLTIANVGVSVRSMYVGQESHESASAIQSLQKEIKQLETQHAETQSLAEVKTLAKQKGFTNIDNVQFVSVPTTQTVAQR